MTQEQLSIDLAEWGEAAYNAQEDWTVNPHEHIEELVRRGDALAAALRAAPAPPSLVALVQRYQRAYEVMQKVNDGEQRVDPDTEGDLSDEEREAHNALLAWTPAAPPVPPTRELLASVRSGLEAIRPLVSERDEHDPRCNGDEDAPCDCLSLRP